MILPVGVDAFSAVSFLLLLLSLLLLYTNICMITGSVDCSGNLNKAQCLTLSFCPADDLKDLFVADCWLSLDSRQHLVVSNKTTTTTTTTTTTASATTAAAQATATEAQIC